MRISCVAICLWGLVASAFGAPEPCSWGDLWTKRAGSYSSDEARSVAVDSSGNVYVCGSFVDTVNFAADWSGTDSKSSAGSKDIFVTKIQSDGTYAWTRRMGGSNLDVAYGICVDSSGNVFVTGVFNETVNFGADWSLTDSKTSAGYDDVFVTKITGAGAYGWTKRMGGNGIDYGKGICVDGSGRVFLVGYFDTTVNFAADWSGTDSKTVAGNNDIFVTQINSNGTYGSTRRIGSSFYDYGAGIAVDGTGALFVVGSFGNSMNFSQDWGGSDNKTLIGGSYDIFVTRINSDFSYGWTRIMGGSGSDSGQCIVTDSSSGVWVSGSFEGTVSFAADWSGTDSKSSAGSTDAFVTKLNSDGTYGWTRRMGGSQSDYVQGIAVDASRNAFLTGAFMGTVNFAEDWGGAASKTSAGLEDVFVCKILGSNSFGWIRRAGGTGEDVSIDVATDSGGNLYLAGYFSDTVNFAQDWGGSDTKASEGSHDLFVCKPGCVGSIPTATPTATMTATPTVTPTPDNGWIDVQANNSISGLLLYGDKNSLTRDMGGLPAIASVYTQQFLPHYVSNNTWYTGITVANPNAAQASVDVSAYSGTGTLIETVNLNVPAHGKVAKVVSSLFSAAVAGSGSIKVTSSLPVASFELYGDKVSGGIGALPGTQGSLEQILPHFVHSKRWWSGISVLNVGSSPTSVSIEAYTDTGVLIDETTATMNPGVKLMGMIESLMPLTANKTGWVLVESSTSPVASVLIYGDKQAIPNRIAALSGTVPSVVLNNSRFEVTAQWWTGVSVVNPSDTTTAHLTLRAREQDGTLIDEITQSLAPLNKVVGLVGSTLFDLSGATEGWVEVISDSPVTGFEMLNADDAANSHWGLAAIEAQETAATLSLAHFIKNSRWWTLFWLTNPQSTIVDGNSLFYDNQGVLLNDELFSIPVKGQQPG